MICAICGKEFEPRSRNQKYCGEECRHEAHKMQMKKYNQRFYRQEREAILSWRRRERALKREAINANQRKWRAANPGKCREYARRYYAAHREEILAKNREYKKRMRRENNDRVNAAQREYRRRRKLLKSGGAK